MSVLRIKKKTDNFVILDKSFLQNNNLSLKAKGLLAYLLSLPDDWQINVSELATHSTDGRDSTYSAIKELKKHRYVIQDKSRSKGKFSNHPYFVYETPQPSETQPLTEIPEVANSPLTGFPYTEKPDTDNSTLLSNNNTNKTIYKENNSTVKSISKNPKTVSDVDSVVFFSKEFCCNVDDLDFMSESLSKRQVAYVTAMVQKLKSDHNCKFTNEAEFIEEAKFAILSPKHFKGNNSFKYQVNAIADLVKKRKWMTPIGFKALKKGACNPEAPRPTKPTSSNTVKGNQSDQTMQMEPTSPRPDTTFKGMLNKASDVITELDTQIAKHEFFAKFSNNKNKKKAAAEQVALYQSKRQQKAR